MAINYSPSFSSRFERHHSERLVRPRHPGPRHDTTTGTGGARWLCRSGQRSTRQNL